MCMLCVEIAKGKMTFKEARRAINEMLITDHSEEKDHLYDVLADLDKDEDEQDT